MSRSPIISLIGRPNVGKSSLFNRLIKKQNKAMTFNRPGVTRDRHYGVVTFNDDPHLENKEAILVDTGGFYPDENEESPKEKDPSFFHLMKDHAALAIEESDLVLLVVDVRDGLLPIDQIIVEKIRESKTDFWLIINKYDSDNQIDDLYEFYTLGISEENSYPVSAEHGLGVTSLRESLHRYMDHCENQFLKASHLQKGVSPKEDVVARVSLVGAPNAGKSTLLNQLLGAERALVSDIPGTTVDPIEGYFELHFGKEASLLKKAKHLIKNDQTLFNQYETFRKNHPELFQVISENFENEEDKNLGDQILYEKIFKENTGETLVEEAKKEILPSEYRSIHLVDTAGIRKQKLVKGYIEEQSVYRSLRCITESDVVIFMIDSTKGISHQDRRLLDIALEKGKSVMIVLNKVDLLKESFRTRKEREQWLEDFRTDIPWLDFCELLPLSAKEGSGIKRLKKALKNTILVRHKSVPTAELNRTIFDMVERHSVTLKNSGQKRFKVKYASMVKTDPPTILLFSNRSKGIPGHYRRYLQNGIRSHFNLFNTPVHLLFRTGKDLKKREKTSHSKS